MLLTIEGCPLKDRITTDVTAAVQPLEGVERVDVRLTPMSQEERAALVQQLRGPGAAQAGGQQPAAIRFDDSTSVIAIASGKGGVGKSSVTVNLAVALAAEGSEGGRARRRRLGVQRAPHDGRHRQAGRLQRHDPAARGPRREGDLDGLLRARGDPRDLARPDAAQGDRAVPGRRLLGRPRLPAVRPAARHRRRQHLARLVPAGRFDARGDHPAGGGPQGRRARRARWPSARTSARSAWSRT